MKGIIMPTPDKPFLTEVAKLFVTFGDPEPSRLKPIKTRAEAVGFVAGAIVGDGLVYFGARTGLWSISFTIVGLAIVTLYIRHRSRRL